MKMQEGIDLINNKPKGFRVNFERKDGCILRSEYFPDDEYIETEWEAWEWANKLACVMIGKAVNFYVVDHTNSPVKDYEKRKIKNR